MVNLIKKSLAAKKVTQTDIAKMLGVTPVAVHHVVSGKRRTPRIRLALSMATGVQVSELWPENKQGEISKIPPSYQKATWRGTTPCLSGRIGVSFDTPHGTIRLNLSVKHATDIVNTLSQYILHPPRGTSSQSERLSDIKICPETTKEKSA